VRLALELTPAIDPTPVDTTLLISVAAPPTVVVSVNETVATPPIICEPVFADVPDPVRYAEETVNFGDDPTISVALAATEVNPPIANARAAIALTRLKLVFVDIVFLSRKVEKENFSLSAWPKTALS
jgi:hypothetical protein